MLFLLFLCIPMIEIAGFIFVGDMIGFWSTMGMIILTAIMGSALLRHQGLETLRKMQASVDQNQLPIDEMLDGVCLLVAGVLLITPGFFTDFIGFTLFIPPLRNLYKELFVSQSFLTIVQFTNTRGRPHNARQPHRNDDVIDVEYEVIDKEDK